MPITKRYTLNELHTLMEEKKSEFNARVGKDKKKEKEYNKKGVEDILKDTERVSGRTKQKRTDNGSDGIIRDDNKTTLHIDFDKNVDLKGSGYNDRVEKLTKDGTPHKLTADEKDPEKNGGLDYSGNENFYDATMKKIDARNKEEEELKTSGLKAREEDPKKFKNNTLKENKTMKRLHFKNTRFLSEAQLIKKVPEEYKTDGNRFYMRDNTGTDYLVECHVDREFNHTTINVLNKINKSDINEQLNRMRSLSDYNSSDYLTGTSNESRELEEGKVSEMLNLMKQMEKSVNK